MHFKNTEKTIKELYEISGKIEYPIFQRSEIWPLTKKKLLIDSILRGIDIPKLYFHHKKNTPYYVIDGRQRLVAIFGFLSSDFKYTTPRDSEKEFKNLNQKQFSEFGDNEKKKILEYPFTVVEVQDSTDEEIRMLFLRLQLGTPTNSGEKLNATVSNMREFVKKLAHTDFIQKTGMTSMRYAKEQVCAQICKNSFNLYKSHEFHDAKFDDLYAMYIENREFVSNSEQGKKIYKTLEILNNIFGNDAEKIKNRAGIISIYFLVEELTEGKIDEKLIKDFYLQFLKELKHEVQRGFDAEKRSLITYNNKVIQGADSKSAVRERHNSLKKFLEGFKKNREIISKFKE